MGSVTPWMSGTTVKPVAGSFLSGVLLVVTAFRQWRRNVLVHYKMERAKFVHKPHRYQSLEGLFGLPRVVLNYLSQIFWPLTIVVSTLCIFVCLPSHIQCHTCIDEVVTIMEVRGTSTWVCCLLLRSVYGRRSVEKRFLQQVRRFQQSVFY